MKTVITANLSKESLQKAEKLLNKFLEEYDKSIKKAIRTATEMMYEKVKQNCYDNGIENHVSEINMEYDETKNIGRIWTDNEVIIFNEMGTGIVGSNNPHPNPMTEWKYDINEHGEKGWKYPKDDGTYGWTKGLPSKHMFYSAFEEIKDQIGDIVEVSINQIGGKIY